MKRPHPVIRYVLIVFLSLVIATALAGIVNTTFPFLFKIQDSTLGQFFSRRQTWKRCQDASDVRLSTPELIRCAYNAKTISADEGIQYLIYAVGEYEKLPMEFNSDIPWDEESILTDLKQILASPASFCELQPKTQTELKRRFGKAPSCGQEAPIPQHTESRP